MVVMAGKTLHPAWWARRILKYGLIGLAMIVPVGLAIRMLGVGNMVKSFSSPPLAITGGVLGGGGAVLMLALFLSLPAAAVFRGAMKLLGKVDLKKAAAPIAQTGSVVARRRLLEGAVAAIPIVAVGLGVAGIAGAFAATKVVPRPMRFANLAPDLQGFKILQVTDLHLGAFHSPKAVRQIVERIADAAPDAVVITGDFCDHLPWLEDALRAFEALKPKHGMYAVFGNHEYYRGARAARRIYDDVPGVDLVMDGHRVLQIGSSKLVLAGVDDPSGWDHQPEHYRRRADIALATAPSDADLYVAMCHRPSGFTALAEHGVDLTLSGHTHGAQTGFNERSVLEPLFADKYLWGRYDHAGKQLYTSSGAGHWAAFRLACPSELPLITLETA